jgi:hypothetical protein
MIVRTASKMRAHLDDFSGKLSAGLSKPARRFVSEVLYGIAARGSVRLSEIGRALEERIALIKTEARLSRNLGRAELRELLGAAVLREGSARIGGRTASFWARRSCAKAAPGSARGRFWFWTSRISPSPTPGRWNTWPGFATAARASSPRVTGCAR